MSYAALFIIVLITIITIVIAILFTIAIDNLAILPDPSNSTDSSILDNVISLGTYVVIFVIFLIAVDLTIAILVYYNSRRDTTSNLGLYSTIVLIIATIGLLYLYREIGLFQKEANDRIITNTTNLIFWSIILTVINLILSFILIFLI